MRYLLSDLSTLAGVPYNLAHGLLRLTVYTMLGALWLVIGILFAAAWIDVALLPYWLWLRWAEDWPYFVAFLVQLAVVLLIGWWCDRSRRG